MPRSARIILAILLVGTAGEALAASTQSAAQSIGTVCVVVETTSPLPEALGARIEASVTRVAERIMVGRPIAMLEWERSQCERIIREVFGRILTGYRIEELTIVAEAETRILIRLSPDGPLVSQVSLSLDTPDLADRARAMLERELLPYQGRFAQVLVGVPVKAFEWAQTVFVPLFQEMLREGFPGFRPSVAIRSGELLTLLVTMTPDGLRTESVQVDVSSVTLPQFLVRSWRGRVRRHLAALEGLPLAFLRRYQVRLEESSGEWLTNDPALARLGLHWRVKLFPGIATRARVSVDAERYSFTARGDLEITDPPILGLSLRAGLQPLPNWELVCQVTVDTSGTAPEWRGSLIYSLSAEMDIGLTYTGSNERLLWLCYASGRGDLFVLGGDLVGGDFSATIGLTVEEQLLVTFTVDSNRQYRLAVELAL